MKTHNVILGLICLAVFIIVINRIIELKNNLIHHKEIKRQELKKKKLKVVKIKLVNIKINKPKPKKIKRKATKKHIQAKKAKPKIAKKQTKNKPTNTTGSNGNDIMIVGAYKLPINSYLNYMRSLGSKVLVYEINKKTFVCEIKDNKFYSVNNLSGFSTRTRRITDDYPHAKEILQRVRENFGPGNYDILLVLPAELDELFYSKLENVLISKGINKNKVLSVDVVYENSTAGIKVVIRKINTVDRAYTTNLSFIF